MPMRCEELSAGKVLEFPYSLERTNCIIFDKPFSASVFSSVKDVMRMKNELMYAKC